MGKAARPLLATVERKDDTIVILADGVVVMLLSVARARWLNARLADVLVRA